MFLYIVCLFVALLAYWASPVIALAALSWKSDVEAMYIDCYDTLGLDCVKEKRKEKWCSAEYHGAQLRTELLTELTNANLTRKPNANLRYISVPSSHIIGIVIPKSIPHICHFFVNHNF